jgi:hypothetical protein
LTDAYNPQGYEPEVPAEPAPPQQEGRSAYHNRRARMPDGSIAVWQESPNGRGGRFVALSEATASTQAREAIEGERARLRVLDRLAPLAEEYVKLGENTATGGWRQESFDRERRAEPGDIWNGLNFPNWAYDLNPINGPERARERSRLETMAGLEDEAVRANIQPGQAGTANSIFEQEVLRGMFPNIRMLGETNSVRAARLFINRDLQQRRVRAAEQWLTRNTDLSGFEEAWGRELQRIRPQLEAEYGARFGTQPGARAGSDVGAFAARAAANRQPSSGDTVEFVRNPQTGRIERRR